MSRPSRRSVFGEMVKEFARFLRELREIGEEVRNELSEPAATREQLEEVQDDVAVMQTKLDEMEAIISTLEEQEIHSAELLRQIAQQLESLQTEMHTQAAQAQGEEEQKRWQQLLDRLQWLIWTLIGATGAALYEALIGDTLYPWLQEQWTTMIRVRSVEGQPASPLQSPLEILQARRPDQIRSTPRIGFDWVTIPAGEFLMGSDPQRDPNARDAEQPQHTVYLSEFRISRVPVTNVQYKQFVDATGHKEPRHWKDGQIPSGKEKHPVTCVSWYDAQPFCEWANVRLPTEAEWEKAARGEDGRIYPWGDDPPNPALCNFSGSKIEDTTEAGSYPDGASPYGVLDMAGNVWEWTADRYASNYYSQSPRENPTGPESGGARTLRGGSFANYDYDVRCASRDNFDPNLDLTGDGFRVVVGVPPGG